MTGSPAPPARWSPLRLGAAIVAALPLSACIVTAPAKAGYSGAKLAGKGAYHAGMGLYRSGKFAVRVADGALDGTAEALRLTVIMADGVGDIVAVTHVVSATALDEELSSLERQERVLEVLVERAG